MITYYTDIEDTFQDKCFEELTSGMDVLVRERNKQIDTELGLEIVQKPTIWQKYGVNCDPDDSNFHKSLYDQFERKGYLSPKQVKALS